MGTFMCKLSNLVTEFPKMFLWAGVQAMLSPHINTQKTRNITDTYEIIPHSLLLRSDLTAVKMSSFGLLVFASHVGVKFHYSLFRSCGDISVTTKNGRANLEPTGGNRVRVSPSHRIPTSVQNVSAF